MLLITFCGHNLFQRSHKNCSESASQNDEKDKIMNDSHLPYINKYI